jgi:acyl dehydratase
MRFSFLQPVFIGETITCVFTITETDARRRASAEVRFTNSQEQVVMEAELSGIVPGRKEKRILGLMRAEAVESRK